MVNDTLGWPFVWQASTEVPKLDPNSYAIDLVKFLEFSEFSSRQKLKIFDGTPDCNCIRPFVGRGR